MKFLWGIPAFIVLTAFLFPAGPFFTAPALAGAVKLDARSMECVKCHEAAVTETGVTLVGDTGGHDHPVGVDYVSLSRRNPTLMKPLELDPALQLVNGRISCVTCHVPYSETNHLKLAAKRKEMPAVPDPLLTVDNAKSALCTSCHLK